MKPTKDKYNLKPCPFCGGEAEINMLFGTYLVGCSICHAGIIPHYEEMPLDKVVEEWNRRSTVEVVRCGDCKYFNANNLECNFDDCEVFSMQSDDFCSYGRREELKQEAKG